MMTLPYAEPYKIKMTEAIRTSTREEREAWIREARYNLFKLRSDQVTIDLLTDSGTGSMSDRQWAAMMTGDESYAGASSYFRLKTTVAELFGMPWFLPTHQGRAAENVIFSALLKEGDIVPGNSHFDTTKGHIEFRRCHAVDCTIDAAADTQLELPFKGEMDLAKLEKVLAENPREKIPCVVLTVTNNTAGGQPVSMRNIRETAELCRRYGVPLLMDSARFAENAYFIKTREEGYASKTIKEIVREMYDWADIMTISAKKDGVVNMGGFVAMRSEELYKKAMSFSIMFEGYVTYGGMSGRDMDALAVGLDENTEFGQLDTRIRQVRLLGDLLDQYGVPYQRPAGGHAIFVDAKKVLPNLPKEHARHYGQRRQRRPLAGRRAHPGGRRSLHDRIERRRAADAPRRADRRGVALLRTIEHGDAGTRIPQPARRRFGGGDHPGQGRNADPPLHRQTQHGTHAAGGVRGTMAEAHPRSGRRNQRHGLLLRPLLAERAGRPRGCHRHLLGRHPGRGVDGPRNDVRIQGVRPLVP